MNDSEKVWIVELVLWVNASLIEHDGWRDLDE